MTLSRSEVFSLCRKAARGAGYDWGLADEIANVCVYLCEQGIDPCDDLAGYLSDLPAHDGQCAFHLGCAISDAGGLEKTTSFEPVFAPIFLCGFLARDTSANWRVVWNDCVVSIHDGAIFQRQGQRDVGGYQVLIDPAPDEVLPITSVTKFPKIEHQTLLDFAAKTYVPDSEESRARGAG